ncbi:MAG: filamentous hemagglutinin N-terminal domain-containing protein [Cyanobacteria bacterium P01_F01_bin.150]
MKTVILLGLLAASWSLLSHKNKAHAQLGLLPDESLGTIVKSEDTLTDLIHGGRHSRSGVHVFHSFREFNIREDHAVYFDPVDTVEHILSRVTGDDPSDILGSLGVRGQANLFLLNPNGMMFGPNARLDIAGSFMASTADQLVFPNGEMFRADSTNVPPLLTINAPIGLHFGQAARNPMALLSDGNPLTNSGHLAVGETLTLAGVPLILSGQLQAGRHLNLRSPTRIEIRDTATEPFIARAGKNLRVQGNDTINISALNHPDSGLFAGGNLVLRSGAPVLGDAYFQSGQAFRIDQLNGRLGQLISLDDPVIQASGDVEFRDYEGASLHILAGGRVRIPGTIRITGADVLGTSIQEQVMLSGRETVIEINGSTEPTLDIRAGVRQPRESATRSGTRADITLGDIQNTGGMVFISNQYRPNRALQGGTIDIASIDTSIKRSTVGTARGGDVVIDSRGDINISGSLTTFARAGNLFGMGVIVGDAAQAFGGNITLLSGGNITTQLLNTSATAQTQGEQIQVIQPDGTQFVQSGDTRAMARGGDIRIVTRVDARGQAVASSLGTITTGDIRAVSRSEADASVDASTRNGRGDGGVAIAGQATARSRGGAIALFTRLRMDSVTAASALTPNQTMGTIQTGTVMSFANANANASANADANTDFLGKTQTRQNIGNGGMATGSQVEVISSQGGPIMLSTWVRTEDVTTASNLGMIRVEDLNSSASAIGDASASAQASATTFERGVLATSENSGDGGDATAGSIANISNQAGPITLSTQIRTGSVGASSDIGTLQTGNINASSIFGSGSASASVATSNFILLPQINASSNVPTVENIGEGGTATGGTVENVSSQGGAIALSTQVRTGPVTSHSAIGHLQIGNVNAATFADADAGAGAGTFADAPGANVTNSGDGGTAAAGQVNDVFSQGGAIALSTQVRTGDVTTGSSIGTLMVGSLNSSAVAAGQSSANADTSARLLVEALAETNQNSGEGGEAVGGKVENVSSQGGAIALSTQVRIGGDRMREDLDTGTIQLNARVDSSGRSVAEVGAVGQNTTSGQAQFRTTGGPIQFHADGALQLGEQSELNASAGTFTFSELSLGPTDTAILQGGNIRLMADGEILLNRISAETNANLTIAGVTRTANVLASSAGNLKVRTPGRIRLYDGASISVEATGQEGRAGAIAIDAQSLMLGQRSRISTETDSGAGGNIMLDVSDLLIMENNSLISTEAGTDQSGGNGGDIIITSGFILAQPQGNSDIVANAFEGQGGNIGITTDGLFGLAFRPQRTVLSDITASSRFGLDGTVVVETPGSDPSRGLTELPSALVDVTDLLDSTLCDLSRESNFVAVGRGGLPSRPSDLFFNDDLWRDRRLTQVDETIWTRSHYSPASPSHRNAPATHMSQSVALTEAQDWIMDDAGTIMLVTKLPHNERVMMWSGCTRHQQ